MLRVVDSELPFPLFYSLSQMSSLVKTATPPSDVFRSALVNHGYRVSPTHCDRDGFKTDAPASFIYRVLFDWKNQSPVSKEPVFREGSPSLNLWKKWSNQSLFFTESSRIDFSLNPVIVGIALNNYAHSSQ